MTDSCFVLPPGERLTDDSTGAPISGATLYFYDAGTTNSKPVYADAGLSASLGAAVVTDSLGYPTSDGTTRTLIYVGTAPYKIVIKDADGNTIATHDGIPGAVVSASSINVAVTALFPVVIKSLDYTILQADQGTTFVGNCSSGNVVFTLPSAVPGDVTQTGQVSAAGWKIKIQHGGTANFVIIKTVSTQTLSGGVASSATQLVLVRQGEEVEVSSDGGNWRVSGHTQGAPHSYTTGVIQIVSRLATAPGSPAVGDKYIVTANGGAWSSFAAGDIATWNGAQWSNQTPPSNCGWIAYVKAETLYYEYNATAWVAQSATPSFAGRLKTATQAVQETATATNTAVTPASQHWHPSAPKVWGMASSGKSLSASYNMTSVTDSGTGSITANFATVFSSANWAASLMAQQNGIQATICLSAISAGAVSIFAQNVTNGNGRDMGSWHWSGLGDQ